MDTYNILLGVGTNMRQVGGPKELGSMLSHLHIAGIKISVTAWAAISKGLAADSCVLKKFVVNLCEFDRPSL
jgi:hypothetical protein